MIVFLCSCGTETKEMQFEAIATNELKDKLYNEAKQEAILGRHMWKLNSAEGAPYVGNRVGSMICYVDVVTKAVYLQIPHTYSGEGLTPLVKDPDLGSFYKYEGDIWEISTLKDEVLRIYTKKVKAFGMALME
jgi:hypothetical protein